MSFVRRVLQRFKPRSLQQLSSRSAYARWAKQYPPTPHNRLMEIEHDTMLHLLPDLTGKRVLDLACGTGRYGLVASEQGATSVIGIDDSVAMLRESPLKQCAVGSMTNIPLPDACMDVVLCGLAVGHSNQLGKIIEEIARVLERGGVALVSDFHPFQYLSGARRTFQTGVDVYEVEHYVHLYEAWQLACRDAGIQIDAVLEPTIPDQAMPVVIVYRLLKV